MRLPRLVLLLTCFVALPLFLTFFSLLYSHPRQRQQTESTASSPQGGLRALFSFHTPSSLFPPSAVISLTDDNSTFFLARPAAFGPLLPSDGLSGQLWVGSGFGDDSLGRGGATTGAEGELGCSDVPGWGDGKHSNPGDKLKDGAVNGDGVAATKSKGDKGHERRSDPLDDLEPARKDDAAPSPSEDDGTDNHLHHPLRDSPIAKPVKPGQPAKYETKKDGQPPAHADIQSLQESAEIAGKVVLLSRGGCGFFEKVKWVQRRGGLALIVGDNTRGGPLVTMYARGDTSNVTIPSLFTSHTTAHLLSSLIPPDGAADALTPEDGLKSVLSEDRSKKGGSKKKSGKKPKIPATGAKLTTTIGLTNPTSGSRPAISPISNNYDSSSSADSPPKSKSGWLRSLGSAIGLGEGSSSSSPSTDSRRPPSSGRIKWIISDSWADEPIVPSKNKESAKPDKSGKGKAFTKQAMQLGAGDDFVIGVQDWRDPDLVNHGTHNPARQGMEKAGAALVRSSLTTAASSGKQTGSVDQKSGKTFAGGSITPGSGEYETHSSVGPSSRGVSKASDGSDASGGQNVGWLSRLWNSEEVDVVPTPNQEAQNVYKKKIAQHFVEELEFEDDEEANEASDHEGLWVTMTPATMSTSPFFDTLLVLVVSPLVTLTVVYALLLLRSRIRRRRWRAPKSVIDRLPVRTYHTIPCSPNATSSQVGSPPGSSPTSPLLQGSPSSIKSRPRPRSQTTSGIAENISSSLDKATSRILLARADKSGNPKKRYSGKQVECVVCLEEYIDGQSRVMSLPCGHEFHAECITPWLTTRRRTCPICKGDVVRSLAANNTPSPANSTHLSTPNSNPYHDYSDDIQHEAARTTNDYPSAAIPIPYSDDVDLEQGDTGIGDDMAATLVDHPRDPFSPRRGWRGLASLSLSAFSGETAWRQAQADRNR